jgi:trehalose 6-phosphate phosphatase
MRYILARASRDVLARFASSSMLLGLDFDGTLAPIVRDPARARMRPSTRRALQQVARVHPCVVISGRAGADVRRRLRGVGVAEVIGNHGIEAGPVSRRTRDLVRRWRRVLGRRLGRVEGVAIETKGLSLAIHYRRSREKAKARAAIRAATRRLDAARLMPGKQVVNVLPLQAGNKGDALERTRTRLGCDTAVYVGDDETDEDVFALHRPAPLLAIRVGQTSASRARYYIRSQAEIDELLNRLLALGRQSRARSPQGPAGLGDMATMSRAGRAVPRAAARMTPEMMASTTSPRTSSMTAAPRMMRAGGVRTAFAS